jgi:hypothetical protein
VEVLHAGITSAAQDAQAVEHVLNAAAIQELGPDRARVVPRQSGSGTALWNRRISIAWRYRQHREQM